MYVRQTYALFCRTLNVYFIEIKPELFLVLAPHQQHSATGVCKRHLTWTNTIYTICGNARRYSLMVSQPSNSHRNVFPLSVTGYQVICFLLEQFQSGTLFLKHVSTRIPSPHYRCSSITRPERCAHPPFVLAIVVIRDLI